MCRGVREGGGASLLSRREGLVTRGSRVLQSQTRRQKNENGNRDTRTLLAISRARRRSAGFTIVQVLAERRPRRVLIKPDIYSGTVAKSPRGEWGLEE